MVLKKISNWIIAGYMMLILLSFISFNGNFSLNKRHLVGMHADYVIYALLFLPWMILANLCWHVNKQYKVFWYVLCIGFALAAAAEILQLLIPHKTFNYTDLIAKWLGVLFGAIICLMLMIGGYRQKRV